MKTFDNLPKFKQHPRAETQAVQGIRISAMRLRRDITRGLRYERGCKTHRPRQRRNEQFERVSYDGLDTSKTGGRRRVPTGVYFFVHDRGQRARSPYYDVYKTSVDEVEFDVENTDYIPVLRSRETKCVYYAAVF